jgi:hypothetical protein
MAAGSMTVSEREAFLASAFSLSTNRAGVRSRCRFGTSTPTAKCSSAWMGTRLRLVYFAPLAGRP